MHSIDTADDGLDPVIDARLRELEAEMPHLSTRENNMFALANAWAERHDAILALASPELRDEVEARLARIGVRWGVMPGSRVTLGFRVEDIEQRAKARRRARRS